MAANDPCFRLEVPLLVHASPQRVTAGPPPPVQHGLLFSLGGRSAGVLPCSDAVTTIADPTSTSAMLWQIENGTGAGVLELGTLLGAQQQQQQQPPSNCLQLAFDVQLFPSVALLRCGDDPAGALTVVGLLASGVLFFQQLAMQAQPHHPHAASTLACAGPTQYHDLSAQLSSHGSPTALAAASGTVLVGCSDGVVLGVSQAARRDGSAAFELQPSSWGINRLITGVFYRSQQTAVAALLPLRPSAATSAPAGSASSDDDKRIVLAVYDDGSVRGFNVARQQLVLSETLAPPQIQQDTATGGARRPTLTFATLCHASPAPSSSSPVASSRQEHFLLASFESSSATAARHHCLYTLSSSGAGRVAVQDKHDLSGLGPAASVLSAAADADTVWALVREHGSTHLHGFSQTGQPCKFALLQEQLRALVVSDNAQDDSVALELWEDVLSSQCASGFSAEEQVLGHVLSPSGLCRFSLRDTLANLGAQLTMGELEACGLQELRSYIAGAVQTLQRRSPSVTHCQSWVLFLRSYREAWSRRHSALGLYTHLASQQLLCVRGGGHLTLLRPCSDAEALWYTSASSSGSHSGQQQVAGAGAGAGAGAQPSQPQLQLLRSAELKAVHSSLGAIAACLGSLSMDAFVALLASGLSNGKALADTFTSLWLDGPTGMAGRPRDDVARGQHSLWRQQRRLLLLQLGQHLGAVHDPVGALQRYCDHLGLEQTGRGTGSSGAGAAGEVPATALVAAAAQQAYARCCSLRDALLLLTAMRRLAAVGTVPLDASALGRAEAVLAPKLEQQLQGAALALWLSATPATASGDTSASGGGGADDPALSALEHLTLGATGAGAAAAGPLTLVMPGRQAAQSQQQHGTSTQPPAGVRADVALAARLLPLALPSLGPASIVNVGGAASRLVAWLQGCGGAAAGAAGSQPTPGWALELGFALLLRQEASALLPLSRLSAASHTRDGSSELLRGLCLVRQLPRGGPSAAAPMAALGAPAADAAQQRAVLVDEAAECFFRAASSFASGGRASLPGIVKALRQIVMGSEDSPAAGAQDHLALHPAAGQQQQQQEALLQFFEVAMMLFERECAPEGALTLARAALQQLSLLSAQTPASSQPASWHPLQGRLWSNVFAYCCELGSYEEAYAAVVANPLPDRALDCLRRLVHELCERGQLRVLCSLPFAGTLTLPASSAPAHPAAPGSLQPRLSLSHAGGVVSIVAEVVAALQRRASNSDLLARPQPYRVLHDFLVARSDFRGAARAMLALARRLRGEGPAGAAADAMAAYEAALNALSLVKEADAWLDLSDPWLRLHACPVKPPPLLFGAGVAAAEQAGGAAGGWEDPVFTQSQLRREYLLLRCAVTAANKLPGMDPLQQWGGEDEVFSQLLLGGETDTALGLAHACFTGAALTAALERALGNLALQAARLQQREEADLAAAAHDSLPGLLQPEQREQLLGQTQLGSRAAPHWVHLRQLLQRYDRARSADGVSVHGGCLRVAVADAILRVDRRLSLPPWLLQLFEEEPSASTSQQQGTTGLGPDFSLLGVYLSHDRLSDAVAMLEARVDAWGRTDPRQRRHLAAVWLPHQRVAHLRTRLAAEADRGSEQAGLLLQRLDSAMQSHVELAAHDSDIDVASLDTAGRTPAAGSWPGFGTPGSADQDMGFGRHSLDNLAAPPPALLWLPPPIETIGS